MNQELTKITNGRNFRELGGYKTLDNRTIKTHKLLRSGHWADLSHEDMEFLKEYGASTIVDFRSKAEVTKQPDRVPDGVDYHFDPVFSEDLTKSSKDESELLLASKDDGNYGIDHMLLAYDDMITADSSRAAYQDLFAKLLANDQEKEALVFHCTAGKDRTGFGALLILSALNLPLSTIKEDYLLTNTIINDYVQSLLDKAKADGANENQLQTIKDIQSVRSEYFDHVVNTIQNEFGDVKNYLHQNLKLSNEDLDELRDLYLD
ncbi:MAG: tyrosine-protein phosphatase [Lactobacillus sp.]|nr:tyrosine-protein phosphatase [Lactobacillus sp.]